ncbi:MAG: hypothetical protein ACOYB3_09390, partial [Azonexus sp.]
MRQQDATSAQATTAPRGKSAGSVPDRSASRAGARDDAGPGDPGSPVLKDSGDAPGAAESASEHRSDLVQDTPAPLEKEQKGDLPIDAASGADPGPAPTVPVYLMALGATAESVQTRSGTNPQPLSVSSTDMRAGPPPRTMVRDVRGYGGLPLDAASGANPGPAPAVQSSPMAMGSATESMQPTAGADSAS